MRGGGKGAAVSGPSEAVRAPATGSAGGEAAGSKSGPTPDTVGTRRVGPRPRTPGSSSRGPPASAGATVSLPGQPRQRPGLPRAAVGRRQRERSVRASARSASADIASNSGLSLGRGHCLRDVVKRCSVQTCPERQTPRSRSRSRSFSRATDYRASSSPGLRRFVRCDRGVHSAAEAFFRAADQSDKTHGRTSRTERSPQNPDRQPKPSWTAVHGRAASRLKVSMISVRRFALAPHGGEPPVLSPRKGSLRIPPSIRGLWSSASVAVVPRGFRRAKAQPSCCGGGSSNGQVPVSPEEDWR